MTFACTKSAGPLNSVSATLNTAAECARRMKTSPHVDSTARMVLISSNVFKFQQQTLKTSQDIISLTSIKLSLKKKTSTPTLLLTNLPSQAVLQPARYHRKTKKILTPPSMIGFPRPVPSQPRSRQGFGLPMSGTNGSLAMPKFQSHPHSSESRRRDSTVPFHSDEGPWKTGSSAAPFLSAQPGPKSPVSRLSQCWTTAKQGFGFPLQNCIELHTSSQIKIQCPISRKIGKLHGNSLDGRLQIGKSVWIWRKFNVKLMAICESTSSRVQPLSCLQNSGRVAGWQGGNPFVWRASWVFLPSGSSTACTPSEQSASRFGSSSLPGQSRRVTVSLARRELDMCSRAGAEASKRISSARGWRGYSLYKIYRKVSSMPPVLHWIHHCMVEWMRRHEY